MIHLVLFSVCFLFSDYIKQSVDDLSKNSTLNFLGQWFLVNFIEN